MRFKITLTFKDNTELGVELFNRDPEQFKKLLLCDLQAYVNNSTFGDAEIESIESIEEIKC